MELIWPNFSLAIALETGWQGISWSAEDDPPVIARIGQLAGHVRHTMRLEQCHTISSTDSVEVLRENDDEQRLQADRFGCGAAWNANWTVTIGDCVHWCSSESFQWTVFIAVQYSLETETVYLQENGHSKISQRASGYRWSPNDWSPIIWTQRCSFSPCGGSRFVCEAQCAH